MVTSVSSGSYDWKLLSLVPFELFEVIRHHLIGWDFGGMEWAELLLMSLIECFDAS